MDGTRDVTVDMGSAALRNGEFLAFRLVHAAGNPVWAFACQDRMILSVQAPQPQYLWYLGHVPDAVNDGPRYALDRPLNVGDVYVVRMSFAQCPSYRLEIKKMPDQVLLLDITYTSHNTATSFPEPFTVTAI